MKKSDKFQIFSNLIFTRRLTLLLAILICAASIVSAQTAKNQLKIKVYFASPDETVSDCTAVRSVTRNIPSTRQTADAALKLLFAGPTNAEKAHGMQKPGPLADYYLGVKIVRGAAIVNFRAGAEEFLHVRGPACLQSQILTPIEKTLLQFSSVKSVDYAIDGVIIEDWDA